MISGNVLAWLVFPAFLISIRQSVTIPFELFFSNMDHVRQNNCKSRIVYDRHKLLALRNTTDTPFDLSFLKNPDLKAMRLPKRGKRGGIRLRLRRRKFKLPLPSIVLGNAQSLGNKCDELSACCKYLNEFRNANLICFSETWLNEEHADPDIPGFSVYRRDRCSAATGKKRGGGVCAFVNNSWCTNVTVKDAICHPDIELLTLALRPFYLPREFPSIFISVVYIHPGADYKVAANTLADVYHRLSSLSPESPSFILGDLNQCRLQKTLPSLKQYVTVPTCGDNILDRCYGPIKDAYESKTLPNLGRSAHRMVQLIPKYVQRSRQVKPVTRTVKVWTQASTDRLNACFDLTDWDMFLEEGDLDQVTDVISSYINFCVESCLETKVIKLYPNNSKPWLSKELRLLFKERHEAISNNNDDKRKQIQKKIDNNIKKEKKAYKNKIEQNFAKKDSRLVWSNVSTITGYKPKKGTIQTDDEKKLADELNTFYTRFDQQDFRTEQKQSMDRVNMLPSIPFTTTEDEVRQSFKRLNVRSAPGPDGITSRTLKMCNDSLSSVFTKLFNRSFSEGNVPNIWKTSTIVPVPKKKTVSQLNDYRPVALTSVPMKCAERLVLKQLREETKDHQDTLQFAYTSQKNTQDAILTLLHSIYQHLEEPKTYARVLFVDFSSAFNTLQPHLLVDKLIDMSVSSSIISWIFSFMTNRPQQVRVGSAMSDTLVTNTGAPQGCVLSPVLFTTYTADCRANDTNGNIQIKFADDTSLSGLIKNEDESSYREAVDELVAWCDRHYLVLNVTKTEEMVIDFRTKGEPIQPLTIKGEDVRQVESYKYLGTIIDNQLNWGENIQAVLKKANQRLFFLRKLRQFKVNNTILQLFYQATILSILLYNQLCYFGSASEEDKKKLNKVVKRAESIIGKEQPNLEHFYKQSCSKKLQDILSQDSHPLKPVAEGQRSKRHIGRFISLPSRTSRFLNTFMPSAIRIINEEMKR